MSVKNIASCTGISEGSVQTILKKRLDLRKVCARWVPHLLTEEQKTQRLKCTRELLKTYKGCNSRVISNLLTGDESLSHKEGLIISNRSEKIKTPMYCQENHKFEKYIVRNFLKFKWASRSSALSIWSYSLWPILQAFCTEESERVFSIRNDQAKDCQESTFNMKTHPHKCEVVKSFLASEKGKALNHLPYSPDLSPCDFFLFPRLKKMLSGNKYTSRSSLGSAIYQCLQQITKEDYLSAFRDWVKRLQKCVLVKGAYFEGL